MFGSNKYKTAKRNAPYKRKKGTYSQSTSRKGYYKKPN